MQSLRNIFQLSNFLAKGMTTYLSPAIQNELIELLGKKGKTFHSGGNKGSKRFFHFTRWYSRRLSY